MQVAKSCTSGGRFYQLPPGAPEHVQVLAKFEYNAVAPRIGEVTINVSNNKGPESTAYAQSLQEMMKKLWFPPRNGINNRQSTVAYRIAKDGSLAAASLFVPSGEIELDQSALDATKAVWSKPQAPLPAGVEKLDVQVTFDVDAATSDHRLVSYIVDPSDANVEQYVYSIQRKLASAWRVPASAGKKPLRESYVVKLINEIGFSTEATFRSGDTYADEAATEALSADAFNCPRPDNLPVGTEFEVTFNYDTPRASK
jgi:hypothetical protein